ncbi:MAG: hypothetical protein KME17_29935 [Cyanosarcina radialis HA8281-LM2]|nr:hypothetical protein [Cyanosarcina radialis HA8281-LM2]
MMLAISEEFRSQKSEVRSQKSEVRNVELRIFSPSPHPPIPPSPHLPISPFWARLCEQSTTGGSPWTLKPQLLWQQVNP